MIKDFYLLCIMLFVMIAIVAIHYTLGKRESIENYTDTIVGLNRLSSPSLSVAWYEPRLPGIEKAANCAYPEMMPINRMDFVYAE